VTYTHQLTVQYSLLSAKWIATPTAGKKAVCAAIQTPQSVEDKNSANRKNTFHRASDLTKDSWLRGRYSTTYRPSRWTACERYSHRFGCKSKVDSGGRLTNITFLQMLISRHQYERNWQTATENLCAAERIGRCQMCSRLLTLFYSVKMWQS
jgi:hypothetical protein